MEIDLCVGVLSNRKMGGDIMSVPSLDSNVQFVMIEKSGGTTYPFKTQSGSVIQSISLISSETSSQFYYDSKIGGYKYSTGSTITMENISTYGLEIQCIALDGSTDIIYIDYIPAPTQINPQLPAVSEFSVTANSGNIMIENTYIHPGQGSVLYWLWYQPLSQPDTFATISFGFRGSIVPN